MQSAPESTDGGRSGGRYLLVLSLTALGIVYGDIGTSPLYALRECFHGEHGVPVSHANVLGVLSLVFWALVLVISTKYLVFILRADNDGEGGILALTALARPVHAGTAGRLGLTMLLGLFGAALLYGDGMITPAISVLSAVEGLNVATPIFQPYVIPITVAILIGLFAFQHHGTAGVGKIFGPITLVWFFAIAVLGIVYIVRVPHVLVAISPVHAVTFFEHNGWMGFLVLGSVFLVVTGGEALYADLGHFGARPIRLTWYCCVLPALLINYFGQGALLLSSPVAAENPFYRMVPSWALFPMVGLATMATVIASQAVISGAFSLTRQAIQLGYAPRIAIEHTSAHEIGQIYIPMVNWVLLIACVALVIGFGSSSNLAAAYGVAVTTTMVITTVLFYIVARQRWKWNQFAVLALCLVFIVVDLSFFSATVVKIVQGGWFPLLIGGIVLTLMTTWRRGRQILRQRMQDRVLPLSQLLESVRVEMPHRVDGTAVFMYSNPDGTPPALLHNLRHNKVIHERVIIVNVRTEDVPHVRGHRRVELEEIGEGFYRVLISYGFMESPDIPYVLEQHPQIGPMLKPMETTYFLGRERLLPAEHTGMMVWRQRLFAWMSRNAPPATQYFCLPPGRVVELGAQIEL